MARFDFEHAVVDTERMANSWQAPAEAAGSDAWGALAVADVDGDGHDEFTVGGRRPGGGGFLRLYDRDPAGGTWTRHAVTAAFRPGVGATALDVDGDGRPELVAGGWDVEGLRWVTVDPSDPAFGTVRRARGTGTVDNPHDLLSGDVDGDGEAEVLAREKDGALVVFDVPDDPARPWDATLVASALDGDGTALADLADGPGREVVTNRGWFERRDGEWVRRPLVPERLDWDDETRVVAADLDGDGDPEVVVTESELAAKARLAVLSRGERGAAWNPTVVLPADLDLRALHSLAVADLDGDGDPEVVTAEMENGKTDGVEARPRWWVLDRAGGDWERRAVLDANLGTHSASVADVDGDGRPDLVGTVWRANDVNGRDGLNHVDVLRNRG
ncbi:MAG: FG-GAP repeat domain-containing protein [Halobacteriaceae archaeon]